MSDLCRTGCGKTECGCGPPRVDPLEGDLIDPELTRALRRLLRIDKLVRNPGNDEFSGQALARAIREVIDMGRP